MPFFLFFLGIFAEFSFMVDGLRTKNLVLAQVRPVQKFASLFS